MISKRIIKELVKKTTDTQISIGAMEFIQSSVKTYIEMLIAEAKNQQKIHNSKLKVCHIPPEKRLNISHFHNAEVKILGDGGKNA